MPIKNYLQGTQFPIPVILDTSVVRHFLHEDEEVGYLDVGKLKSAAVPLKLSISWVASAELMDDLMTRAIPFDLWARRVPELDSVIDRSLPVFPGGRHLGALLWIPGTGAFSEDDRLGYRVLWRLMSRARQKLDLIDGITYHDSKGKPRMIANRNGALQQGIEKQRQWWRGSFGIFEAVASQHQAEVKDVSDSIRSFDGKTDRKLDVIRELYAQFLDLKQKGMEPSGEKRRGDVFDFQLVLPLALPAVVLCDDEKLVNRCRQLPSPRWKLLMTVKEFHKRLVGQTLVPLLLEFRSR